MIAKKIALLIVVVMLAGTYFATDSDAEQQWYLCKVDAAGPGWGAIYIQLTDKSSTFTKKWFTVPTNGTKEVLAVALTAINNGMPVNLNADVSQSVYPTIIALYLQSP